MNNSPKHAFENDRLKDAGTFPRVVLIDTISFCNLRCSMCFHKDMKRKQGIMPWDLYVRIIDEISETNKAARIWLAFFGEVLLLKKTKPGIFSMIAYAKKKGLTDVVINTNGNLLDEKTAHELIVLGLDSIYVGIDAHNAKTYENIRIGGCYKTTVDNIVNLLKLKEKERSQTPAVYVQFVEMELNKNEKKPFIDFWTARGAFVKIRPMVSWGGLIHAPNLILDNRNRKPCHWIMQTMSITDTGTAVLCAVDLDASCNAGDVRQQSMKDIWNSRLKELRELHRLKKWEQLPDFCRNCRDWQSAKAEFYQPQE